MNFFEVKFYLVNSYFNSQQDVVLGTLTVRENLWYSASLRLPRTVSAAKKKQRIDEILYDLGLVGCADSKVSIGFYCMKYFRKQLRDFAESKLNLHSFGGAEFSVIAAMAIFYLNITGNLNCALEQLLLITMYQLTNGYICTSFYRYK